MLSIGPAFVQSKKEVNAYFLFMDYIDQGNVQLCDSSNVTRFVIDSELEKTMKANAFLLLYNLVESTLRNGLWEIHSVIQSEGIDYNDLEFQIKLLLVGGQVRARFQYGMKNETVAKNLCDIVEKVLNDPSKLHPPEMKYVRFNAGNLDISTINETFKVYGLTSVAIRHDNQKEAFRSTKENRNNLAHGNKTFNECGKSYSFIQLNDYKEEIFEYLQRVLDEIDSFISNKKYRKGGVSTSITAAV